MSATMESPLQKEFEYFRTHQAELVEKYRGRYVVIKHQAVIGDYASMPDAVLATTKVHEMGTFLVQLCEPGDEVFTEVFHSRVAFA